MNDLSFMKSTKIFFIIFLIFNSINISYPQNYNKIDSLETLFKSIGFDSTRINIQIELFKCYIEYDTAKSERYLENLIQEIEKEKINVSSGTFFEIGKIYENYKNDYMNAIKYYDLAVQKAKKENNIKYITYDSWLGYTYSKTGESEKALEKLLHNVEIAENNNIFPVLPRIYLLLAFAFRDIDNIEKAEKYFNKSIDVSNKIGDSTDIHTALHEIGNLYNIKSDYKKAVEFHTKALKIREEKNLINELVYSYNDIALDYLFMDSFDVALNYSFKAEKLAFWLNEKWVLSSIYAIISDIYTRLKKFKDAESYLKKLQVITDELNMKSTYKALYHSYYIFYKSLNQFENALKYYELEMAYKDSISSEEVKKNISELDKKYETAKKDKEIVANKERIKLQQSYIITVIIGLVVVVIFMIIIFRQYRQIRQANIKLEHQNQEILKQKEAIRTYADELREFNETKDKLFTIIAHDLRSPFVGIQGCSDLLLENLQQFNISEIEKYVEQINQSSRNTLDLLDKLLAWAKNQTGQISFNPVNIKLEPLVREIIDIFDSSVKIKNISLNYISSDETEVYADREMLKTILRNLIQNAIKFTNSNGKIEIFAVKNIDNIEVTVSDNGIGMNDYIKENIFCVGKKKTLAGTADETGSGLGLILCSEFVKKHDGKIWVESELGKGSDFKFTLPI